MASNDRTADDGSGHRADDDEPLAGWRAEHPDWIAVPATVVRHRIGPTTSRSGDAGWSDAAVAEGEVSPGSRGIGEPPPARGVGWSAESDPVAVFLRINAGLDRMGLAANAGKSAPVRHGHGEAVGPIQPLSTKRPNVAQAKSERAVLAGRTESPNAGMTVSPSGRVFLLHRDTPDLAYSAHTYWPKGESGVTIGLGYDMQFRSPEQIESDLTRVRVPPAGARKVAAAGRQPGQKHGLVGRAAEQFAKEHAKDVTLTESQQVALLALILPAYEADVRRAIHVPLNQNEFDALVALDYNEGGGGWVTVAAALNAGRRSEAALLLQHLSDKQGSELRERRAKEAALMRKTVAGNSGVRKEALP